MPQPGGSQSEGSSYISRTISSEPDFRQSTPETAELLEKVVRETLSIGAADVPFDAGDMRRLREVARRHAGAALTTEPAAELIYVLLEGLLEGVPADVWRDAASEIAGTLLDDPRAKARLERFWTRLSGEVS